MKNLTKMTILGMTGMAVLAGAPLAISADAPAGVQAVRVESKGPVLDPASKVWANAPSMKVAMLPQGVALPMNNAPAVPELSVQSVHNGDWLSVRLEWKDGTQSDKMKVDQFADQVAVEFPVVYTPDALPSPMMGDAGGRVNILQWRSALQAMLDRKGPDLGIKELYPNANIDLYVEETVKPEDAKPYTGAAGLGNPVAARSGSPVLDQIAEGFGSLTIKQHQMADGKGVWKDGAWHVVIATPMRADGPNGPRFVPGKDNALALAVWDGGSSEVGSRKAWSDWVTLNVQK